MTVGELKKELEKFDETLPALVAGYESGYNGTGGLSEIQVAENKTAEWFDGFYESGNELKAVLIQ